MNRLAAIASVLALATGIGSLVSCSSSLGEGTYDVMAEGVVEPIQCAEPGDLRLVDRCSVNPVVSSATAVQALAKMDEVASAALGVERVWGGRMNGVGIGRDGMNLDSGLSGWTTFWVSGSLDDPDMLVLDTTAGDCRNQNRCTCVSAGTCPAYVAADIESAVKPAVDSAAAILAAFPDDSADQKYDLSYDGKSGAWTVAHAAVIVSVDAVDGDAAADTFEAADVPASADSARAE